MRDQLLQHPLEAQIGADDIADLVQQLDLASGFRWRHDSSSLGLPFFSVWAAFRASPI